MSGLRPKVRRAARPGAPAAPTGPAPETPVPARPRARVGPEPDASVPIWTSGLTKEYDDIVAVDRLDLEVRPGEIFGLLGANGAGKTTTILMLLGLTEPTDGAARVIGLDPVRNPLEVKRRVGYLPDAVGFYGNMTGRENLRYTARLNRIPNEVAEPTIDEVLAQVGLTDRGDTRADTYSRGMLQRLGIADALVKDPSILILDEPTAAIDPLGVVEILDLLRELVRIRGMTVLLSSHLLNQVQNVCDRVGIFAAGRLVDVGTVEELAHRFGGGKATVEVGLELEGPAEADTAEAALRQIEGVVDVARATRPGELWTLVVAPPEVATRVRQEVLATSLSSGLNLSSIRATPPSLDDIYRSAVTRAARRVAA
jgi:ABC-2 type transport system ATP-binding protein